MKNFRLILFLSAVLGAFSLPAQYNKAARRGTAKAASELSGMAREIRVSRNARDQLEDHARIIEYAVKHEQFTPAELRKVQSIVSRIEKMLERVEKNGKMSVSEAQALHRELARAYRTIWFLRRNSLGKEQKIVFLGRQLRLRDEYLKKFEAGSLNQKEMKEIMHAYYSACRTGEQLRTDNLKPDRRARLEKECFEILSDYFTLVQPEAGP